MAHIFALFSNIIFKKIFSHLSTMKSLKKHLTISDVSMKTFSTFKIL